MRGRGKTARDKFLKGVGDMDQQGGIELSKRAYDLRRDDQTGGRGHDPERDH